MFLSGVNFLIVDTPEFIFLPQNTTVTHGSNISLHCQAFSSPPNSILWTRENNTPIKSGYMLYERNFTVVIPNAEKSDAGKYICTAQNLNNSQLNRISRYAYVTVNCKYYTNKYISLLSNQLIYFLCLIDHISFVCSFVRLFICLFVHLLIQSFIHCLFYFY